MHSPEEPPTYTPLTPLAIRWAGKGLDALGRNIALCVVAGVKGGDDTLIFFDIFHVPNPSLKIVINTDEMVLHQARTLSVPGSGISASCGALHPLRPLGGPCVLQTAAPKIPPCMPLFVAARHLPPAGGSLCPQAAVGILALNSTHSDALGKVLLENEEDDDDRHSSQCGTCHDQPKSVLFSACSFAMPSEMVRLLVLDSMINCMK